MKLYGSLTNRMMEGRTTDEIKVNDDITMYYYTDRRCYWVKEVNSQKDIVVASYRVKHVGEPMTNNWEYIKEEDAYTENWVYRYNKWMKKVEFTMADYIKVFKRLREDLTEETPIEEVRNYVHWQMNIDDKDFAKLNEGKTIVKYYNLSGKVSFGVKDYYHDYNF